MLTIRDVFGGCEVGEPFQKFKMSTKQSKDKTRDEFKTFEKRVFAYASKAKS